MLATKEWLKLPWETRMKMSEIFSIPKSASTVVIDNQVVSDGYTEENLSVITADRLRDFTGLDTDDFYKLFYAAIDRVEGKQTNEENAKTENPGPKSAGKKK